MNFFEERIVLKKILFMVFTVSRQRPTNKAATRDEQRLCFVIYGENINRNHRHSESSSSLEIARLMKSLIVMPALIEKAATRP